MAAHSQNKHNLIKSISWHYCVNVIYCFLQHICSILKWLNLTSTLRRLANIYDTRAFVALKAAQRMTFKRIAHTYVLNTNTLKYV